jgi:hypothetical protein
LWIGNERAVRPADSANLSTKAWGVDRPTPTPRLTSHAEDSPAATTAATTSGVEAEAKAVGGAGIPAAKPAKQGGCCCGARSSSNRGVPPRSENP